MQKANRHARHYVGRDSEINVGKPRSYGIKTVDKGVGSDNMSGCVQYGTKEHHAKAQREIDEARAVKQALRDKKAERGLKRAQRKIDSIIKCFDRGQITLEERNEAISKVWRKHKEAERRNLEAN